jgi:Fe-S oxidoreductase
MRRTEKLIELCDDCGACVRTCTFLHHYCDTPKELAKRFKRNPLENIDIPYSCSLCGLCQRICPLDLYPGDMCLETREKIFQTQQLDALPNDFVYDYMIPRLKSLRNHQIISTYPFFTFSKIAKNNKRASKSVFFPGCSLPAYSPRLVLKAYQYLQQKIPGIGIVLNCCGKPSRDLGDKDRFQNIFGGTLKEFSRLGIEEVVVACINCHKMYRENTDIKLRTIYEIMAEMGLPESISGDEQVITIHDSCPARYKSEIRNAVRQIASQMNFSVSEMKFKNEVTQCCGAGGCSPMGNTALADRHTSARVTQAKGLLVSYCGNCRERFSSYVPSLHILDIIFGTSYNKHVEEYQDSWRNWLNRWYLKKRFQLMKI